MFCLLKILLIIFFIDINNIQKLPNVFLRSYNNEKSKIAYILKHAGCPRGGGRSPNSDNDEQGRGDKKSNILPDVLCE